MTTQGVTINTIISKTNNLEERINNLLIKAIMEEAVLHSGCELGLQPHTDLDLNPGSTMQWLCDVTVDAQPKAQLLIQ